MTDGDNNLGAGKRVAKNAETRLLREWISARYPSALVMYELRLGPTDRSLVGRTVTPELERMLRVANWYADAVILTDVEGLIVEAKVEPKPRAVGEVLWYFNLYFSTPELQPYLQTPFTPVVLFGERDARFEVWASSLGVRVEVFTPDWIADYLTRIQFRGRGSRSATPTAANQV